MAAKTTLKALLAEANSALDTLDASEAIRLMNAGEIVLVDVREEAERREHGAVPGAVAASRGFLEFMADPEGPLHNPLFASGKRLVLFCATGGRSALAGKTLLDLGIDNVAHIRGGFGQWKEAGGATESV